MDTDPAARHDDAETLLLAAASDEVRRALADPAAGAALAEWAARHLVPDCLLTADELALYARLAVEVEALSRDLRVRLADAEQRSRADGLLRRDDALLAGLQKLGRELDRRDPAQRRDLDRLRDACARLAEVTAETARTKLDAAYVDALERAGPGADAPRREVQALEDKVESLYAEIGPVTHMSVHSQHLEPAVRSAADEARGKQARTVQALEYISDCLDHLRRRMGLLGAHVEAHRAHRAAALGLAAEARAELASPASPPPLELLADELGLPAPLLAPRGARQRAAALDAALADSPYGDVRLVDPDVEASVLVLEQEAAKATERLRAVARLPVAAESERRDEIVRRFA